MKNKKLCATLLLGFSLTATYAQQAVTTAGGDASGTGGSVAYSVGQTTYTSNFGTTGMVAQGVQQPFELTIITGLEVTDVKVHLSAYPNPTANYLMLEIDNYDRDLTYQVYDISGKLLESKTIGSNSTIIIMEQLATGSYFLKVTQNNTLVKTFKIIKN